MAVVSDCINVAIPAAETLPMRKRLIVELLRGMPGADQMRQTGTMPTAPCSAYTALFSEDLDPWLVERIERLYADCTLPPAASPRSGFIYVFRDDRDPQHVYKVGATRQASPEHRLAQWRNDLGDTASPPEPATAAVPRHITLMFSFATLRPMLAEDVLQALLWCRQLPARVNRLTGHQLIEYYFVHDARALRLLCCAITRHVDAFATALAMK